MTRLIHSIHVFENKFDRNAERFVYRHPFVGSLAIFIGIPAFMILAVGVSTSVIMLPISVLCGW